MTTVKVSEATGVVLDYLVAKAQGLTPTVRVNQFGYVVLPNIPGSYSEDWNYGGPLIDREKINLEHEDDHARASFYKPRATHDGRAKNYHCQQGPTPLIAAMRCYVSWKLGDEVEVPDELLSTTTKDQP